MSNTQVKHIFFLILGVGFTIVSIYLLATMDVFKLAEDNISIGIGIMLAGGVALIILSLIKLFGKKK